ncbi:MAG: DUF6167 family protein [Nocardioides sp.]|nr:DUF6167 family protein [Nocardioides sp.]
MNRVSRLREAVTVEGLKDRVGALALGARMLREEVAQGQTEKEFELRARLGLTPDRTPQLEPGAGRHRIELPNDKDKEGTT